MAIPHRSPLHDTMLIPERIWQHTMEVPYMIQHIPQKDMPINIL